LRKGKDLREAKLKCKTTTGKKNHCAERAFPRHGNTATNTTTTTTNNNQQRTVPTTNQLHPQHNNRRPQPASDGNETASQTFIPIPTRWPSFHP